MIMNRVISQDEEQHEPFNNATQENEGDYQKQQPKRRFQTQQEHVDENDYDYFAIDPTEHNDDDQGGNNNFKSSQKVDEDCEDDDNDDNDDYVDDYTDEFCEKIKVKNEVGKDERKDIGTDFDTLDALKQQHHRSLRHGYRSRDGTRNSLSISSLLLSAPSSAPPLFGYEHHDHDTIDVLSPTLFLESESNSLLRVWQFLFAMVALLDFLSALSMDRYYYSCISSRRDDDDYNGYDYDGSFTTASGGSYGGTVSGVRKVTIGATTWAAILSFRDMVWASTVWSNVPHALKESANSSRNRDLAAIVFTATSAVDDHLASIFDLATLWFQRNAVAINVCFAVAWFLDSFVRVHQRRKNLQRQIGMQQRQHVQQPMRQLPSYHIQRTSSSLTTVVASSHRCERNTNNKHNDNPKNESSNSDNMKLTHATTSITTNTSSHCFTGVSDTNATTTVARISRLSFANLGEAALSLDPPDITWRENAHYIYGTFIIFQLLFLPVGFYVYCYYNVCMKLFGNYHENGKFGKYHEDDVIHHPYLNANNVTAFNKYDSHMINNTSSFGNLHCDKLLDISAPSPYHTFGILYDNKNYESVYTTKSTMSLFAVIVDYLVAYIAVKFQPVLQNWKALGKNLIYLQFKRLVFNAVRNPFQYQTYFKRALRILRWVQYLLPLVEKLPPLHDTVRDFFKQYRQRRHALIAKHFRELFRNNLTHVELVQDSALRIQKAWRAYKQRNRCRVLLAFQVQCREEAAMKVQAVFRAALQRARHRIVLKQQKYRQLMTKKYNNSIINMKKNSHFNLLKHRKHSEVLNSLPLEKSKRPYSLASMSFVRFVQMGPPTRQQSICSDDFEDINVNDVSSSSSAVTTSSNSDSTSRDDEGGGNRTIRRRRRRKSQIQKQQLLSASEEEDLYELERELKQYINDKLILRPNTYLAVVWKAIVVTAMVTEVITLAYANRIPNSKTLTTLEQKLEYLFVPRPINELQQCRPKDVMNNFGAIIRQPIRSVSRMLSAINPVQKLFKTSSSTTPVSTNATKSTILLPSSFSILVPRLLSSFSSSSSSIPQLKQEEFPWYCTNAFYHSIRTLYAAFIRYVVVPHLLPWIGTICYMDVFVVFFTGVYNSKTGVLEPKPFRERWIIPGLCFQLLVNPLMTNTTKNWYRVYRLGLHYGIVRSLRWMVALFYPTCTTLFAIGKALWKEIVSQQNKQTSIVSSSSTLLLNPKTPSMLFMSSSSSYAI